MNCGTGDPNEKDGAYQQALGGLYAVAYTLKMSYKTGYTIPGFFEYVGPPLEGFWWQKDIISADYRNKSSFGIRLRKQNDEKKKAIMLNDTGFDARTQNYDAQVRAGDDAGVYPFAGYEAVLAGVYALVHRHGAKRVLDIGFGTGCLTKRLYDAG